MSPVSRGRKKKNSKKSGRGREPSLRQIYAGVIEMFGASVENQDPLDAEQIASSIIGGGLVMTDDYELDDLGLMPLIGHASNSPSRNGLALLRAVEAIGVTAELRKAAAEGAAAVASTGVAEPAWGGALGPIEAGHCWLSGDVYGDSCYVVAELVRGGHRHAVSGHVGLDGLNGMAEEVNLLTDTDGLAEELAGAAEDEPLMVFSEIQHETGMRLLRNSIPAAVDYYGVEDDPDDEESAGADYYALVYARYRALGLPEELAADGEPIPKELRDQIAADFVAAVGAELKDQRSAGELAAHAATFGYELDAQRPLRVSPAKTAGFLLGYLPQVVTLSDEALAAVPAFISAWTDWVAGQMELPDEAIDDLQHGLDEALEAFPKAYKKSAGKRT
jgi:hypothetical protein